MARGPEFAIITAIVALVIGGIALDRDRDGPVGDVEPDDRPADHDADGCDGAVG